MNHITRRSLLKLGAGSFAIMGAGGRLSRLGMLNAAVNSSTPNYKALVCIFLFGGNDSNNVIVPMQTSKQSYADYFAVRGTTLGLTQNSLLSIPAAGGSDHYGLHTQFGPIQSLYSQGKAAFVANVGMLVNPINKQQYKGGAAVPMNLFSHSDQQQQWQTAPGPNSLRNGWGGRAGDILAALNQPSTFPTGVSLAGNSLFLTGQNPAASVSNGGLGLDGSDGSVAGNARDNAFQQILTFDTGLQLIQSANQAMSDGIAAGKALNAALAGGQTLTTVFPNTGLGNQLKQVAQILKVRTTLGMTRQIFFVSQGGYDTHTTQMPQQDSLFGELAPAIAAFYNSTVELGLDNQVVTFTESEFGRTCQPDTGAGSDHAWGSHHVVVGGALKAADVYGTFPSLALNGPDDATGRGVYIPTTSLDQYGATLASWFGVPDTSLTSVFPNLVNFTTKKLTFL